MASAALKLSEGFPCPLPPPLREDFYHDEDDGRGQQRFFRSHVGVVFDALTGKGGADTPKVSATNIYELPDGTDVDGNPFEYTSLKGKVVLITNVASR